MADAVNKLPSEPPPKDPERLRAWLEQFWRAVKDMKLAERDHETRIADLENPS